MQLVKNRSNRSIFVPQESASPRDGVFTHISSPGKLTRLDFEQFNVAGEVIFRIEGDAAPTTQQDEEARIGSLAYALKKLGKDEERYQLRVYCLSSFFCRFVVRHLPPVVGGLASQCQQASAVGIAVRFKKGVSTVITIVNRKTYRGENIYIGRPTALGNPFVIGKDGDRSAVIFKYRRWRWSEIQRSCGPVFDEIHRLAKMARANDLTLGCWCDPLPCHGDIIKACIEYINSGQSSQVSTDAG